MDELRPIRVFLEVAAQRSFAGAARRLRITPASVTRIVARLEAELGQQLLTRTTRQVALTSAGALVAARYQPLVQQFDGIAREIRRAGLPDRGALKINAPVSMGVRLLPGLVESFRVAYPDIALDIQMTDALVDIMQEDCDLSIRISRPPTDKSTIWRKLCEVPRYAVAAPALFDRLPRPEHPEALRPQYALSYGTGGQPETWVFRKGATRRVVRAGTEIVSNNGDLLYLLAAAGAGIAVLPGFIVAEGLASGAVERLFPDWQVEPLWLTLYYPPYEQLPPLVATFTEFFEAYLRQIEGLEFAAAEG
ncbi:LysR family transcriptional regulator [Roseobacter sinensis]|uniref:LysR family transcriptional regulator n=1 Tax=Roseobacter sinensis TaxID=2931391 RepID=A0ABT3BC77_9RHOB|nr:LysR family transcriptional regulator [Roseobacter sp. WL0113]MCV3271173.1 LysR family transcriptional regulator [Roseobacter sp. WL0113]